MKRYEYTTWKPDHGLSTEEIVAGYNEFGKAGWRLIRAGAYVILFERELKDE